MVAALVCSCGVALAQRSVESGGFKYSVQGVPAWVAAAPKASDQPWSAQGAVRYLLVDTQDNLLGAVPVMFQRVQVAAQDQAGLSEVATIRIQFNPAYQQLALHEVGVTRNGVRGNRLPKIKFELLQRETQLEKSVYDGLVTALAIVEDVRAQDIVDYSFSVRGANPVFKNKFAGTYQLNAVTPTRVRRVRIEYPGERTLHFKTAGTERQPTVSAKGKNSVLELILAEQAPVPEEDRIPAWSNPYPQLQVSEYRDWAEVRAWAMEHYRVQQQLSPELLAIAEGIRRDSQSSEERVARTLKFVQEQIRYFAVATGTSSHMPSPPNATFARRYGDCKDKALLTVALLQQLGIQARPALVSATRLRGSGDFLPMPQAFDHAITQARVNGAIHWLDGTQMYQAGDLGHLGFTPFGFALVVSDESEALTRVVAPSAYDELWETTERFSIRKYSTPIPLTVTTRVTAGQAERMRAYLAAKGIEVVSADLMDSVLKRYPGVRRAKTASVADDPLLNELVITEYYEVADLFKYANGRVSTGVFPLTMARVVRGPEKVTRATPLGLAYPVTVTQRFEFELPTKLRPTPAQPVNFTAPQFVYSYRSLHEAQRLTLQHELRTLRDEVTPAEMPAYLSAGTQVMRYSDRQVSLPLFDVERAQADFAAAMRADEPRLRALPEWTRRFRAGALSRRLMSQAAIDSGQLEGKSLADAWTEVAVERSSRGERKEALQAVAEALKADPQSARAFKVKAEILAYTGQFDAALPEMKRALSLNKDEGIYGLGQIQYYLGQYSDAMSSFADDARRTAAAEQTYRYLWLYLAAMRAGANPSDTLKRAGYSSQAEWPGPIASYLLGETTEDALLEAAKANKNEAAPRLCETWFFIGQKQLMAQDSERARRAFQSALDTKIEPYLEYTYSEVELARLKN
jgi:lipoprotein NlpI/transglutaminase-like putative cysteine protease